MEPLQLHNASRKSLEMTPNPRRVVLLHTGAILLLSLLMAAVDHLLNRQIGTTGGLSGLETRSFLTTVQSLLRMAQMVILPFWQMGYTYYTLRVARNQEAGLGNLTEGFRRFGPVLRLQLLTAGILLLVCLGSTYLSSFLFLLLPGSSPLVDTMMELAGSDASEEVIMETLSNAYAQSLIPVLIIFGIVLIAALIFVFFRYRMAHLWLMDHPDGGALAALRNSRWMLSGNCKALFRVDLHFWWFYLLEVLVTALCYGDLLLSAMGVEMTMDAYGNYLIFFGVYLCAQLALYGWKGNEVNVTYAHAYLSLLPEEEKAVTPNPSF